MIWFDKAFSISLNLGILLLLQSYRITAGILAALMQNKVSRAVCECYTFGECTRSVCQKLLCIAPLARAVFIAIF